MMIERHIYESCKLVMLVQRVSRLFAAHYNDLLIARISYY